MYMARTGAITTSNEGCQQTSYSKEKDEVLKEFKVDPTLGLSEEEAKHRLAEHGQNVLPKTKRSIWRLYFAPFLQNTIIIIYLLAATLMIVLIYVLSLPHSLFFSVYLNFGIVILNALIAIFQQLRAQTSLNALKKLAKNECVVIRDGNRVVISSGQVVPGDILDLQEGARIVADARVIQASNLSVSEASINGESMPVNKHVQPIDLKIECRPSILELKNCVFSGTFVTKGNGRAVVFATGIDTEIGRISKGLSEFITQDIPLTHKINKFANILAIFVLVIFFIYWAFTVIVDIDRGILSVYFGVDLINSIQLGLKFIPINLVLLATIILLTGVVAIARKGVLTRNLNAIESLGLASVVCTDKTGTLTKNEMTVKFIWAGDQIFELTGAGYSRDGQVLFNGERAERSRFKVLEKLAISGMMNNNADFQEEEVKIAGKQAKTIKVRHVIGDPMEAALDVVAEKLGISEKEETSRFELMIEYPFESDLKRMAKVWASKESSLGGKWIVYEKGASELMLERSSRIMYDEDEESDLDDAKRALVRKCVDRWASQGFRTLGIAYREIDALPEGEEYQRDEVEKELVFLGFVIIQDPPRDNVKTAVQACNSAGVGVVMITGDSVVTGRAIAKELGIFQERKGDIVAEGKEIATLSDADFFRTSVFARVSPDDKENIVRRYQDHKHVVAMTGDGVNDALALGLADVGLAMGIAGTDVAKEAAALIISDDSFATIEVGIREGRALFAKIRAMIFYYIFANVGEAIVLISTAFMYKGFLLFDTGLQINIIYFFMHSLPPIGLTFDRTPKEVMNEKPRDGEEIFNRNNLRMLIASIIVLVVPLFISAMMVFEKFMTPPVLQLYIEFEHNPSLAAYANNTAEINNALAEPRTIAITILFIVETIVVFVIRRPNIPIYKTFRRDMSPTLIVMVILNFFVLFAIIYIPLQKYIKILNFYVTPLSLNDWIEVLVLSLPALPVLEVFKLYFRRHHQYF
jgi:Ca2+-transporting ATPase